VKGPRTQQTAEGGRDYANLFYRNSRLWGLTVGFILVVGIAALQTLNRQEDPTMADRFGTVETYLPGASSTRVESLVTERIETDLREITEVAIISSRSRTGASFIRVELVDSLQADEVDVVWSEVRDKLAEVETQLPVDATSPDLQIRGPVAVTLVAAMTWKGSMEPQLGVMERIAEDLRVRLGSLGGTRKTEIFGAAGEEVRVEIIPRALAAIGVTVEQLADRIAAADTRIPAGKLHNTASDLLVEVKGELSSVERIAQIPVMHRDHGQYVRVGDVARVRKIQADPPENMAMVNGHRALVVAITMEPGRRIDLWVENTRRVIDNYRQELPREIGLTIIFDQNRHTGERLSSLLVNLLTALVIVLLLLVFFMGIRSALTVGMALPLSIAMVLGGLQYLDIPLHQISVTGLIISLGLLIDNAIVVVEEYKLKRRQGHAMDKAVSKSVRQLFTPLAASTATTAFAFLPVALTPGGTGEFTGSIGISVVLSVTSSFLLAMTVIPAAAGFIEKRFPIRETQSATWYVSGFSSARLSRLYERSLDAVLRRPLYGVFLGLLLPLLGFGLTPTLLLQFFPPVDRNQFHVQSTLPVHSSIDETWRHAGDVYEMLKEYESVKSASFFVGQSAPQVYYNVTGRNEGVSSYTHAIITTGSAEETRILLPALQDRLMAEFPDAQIMVLPFEQGPPFDAPIEVRVFGDDIGILRVLGERIRSILASVDSITYTGATLSGAEPKVIVRPDENLAMRSGFALGDLSRQLNAALSGRSAGVIMEGTHEIPVIIRYRDADRKVVDNLAALPLTTQAGDIHPGVPLERFGTMVLEPAASAIDHYQGRRVNIIQGFLVPFVLPASAQREISARLQSDAIGLPPGYRIEYGGESEQRNESVTGLINTFMLFLILMIAVVVLALNSFGRAAIIGVVGFLSIGLALFGVRLFGWPLGFTAMIGTLGLVGLAINGAIIVLSSLQADPTAASGDLRACRQVVVDATRHIVSTTFTTIGGFMPLILFGGTFWPPLATAIAGGVAGSAILALYMVPALFIARARRRLVFTSRKAVA